MVEVVYGERNTRQKIFREIGKEISSTIDNFEIIKEINLIYENNGLNKISMGEHRVYGHWGFAQSIPQSAFDEFFENIDSAKHLTNSQKEILKNDIKEKIIASWRNDVNRITDIVGKSFPELNGSPKQIKGLAGLLYNIHLLGDYTTHDVEHLHPGKQNPIKYINDDIKKNM